MADFSSMWEGLLGAHDGLVNPRAPAGAGYTDETARMARAALLGNLGATLLAAGQGGQSFDQRARILAGLGSATTASAQILQGGTSSPEDRARTAHLQAQTDLIRSDQERARKAAEWLQNRDSGASAIPPSAIPTTTASGPPTAGKVAAGPALPPMDPMAVLSAPLPPVSGAPAPPSSPGVPGAAPAPPGAVPAGAPAPMPPQGAPFRFSKAQVDAMVAGGMKADEIIKMEIEQGLKQGKQNQLDPSQVLNAEGELRKEFTGNEAVKGFNEAQRQYNQMQQIVKAANSGQPGAGVNDTALVYAFFKTIDPTSTVREGEFATVGANMGLPAQVTAALQKIDGKGFLTPETRKELAKVAEGYLFRRYEDVDRLGENFKQIATGRGLRGENVVVDPRAPELKKRYVVSQVTPEMILGAGNDEAKALRDYLPYMTPEQLAALKQRLMMQRPGRFGGGN